ncbi:unnamed protein product [Cylicostephanus goldi]|uniref:Uncharacterized protein n=1 Tax=Cylicostephanus goldi TaxID=71465 RepID=A0A3P7N0V6_CYLGO|nr:unnamed protein product [Cylicostephanus goldi]
MEIEHFMDILLIYLLSVYNVELYLVTVRAHRNQHGVSMLWRCACTEYIGPIRVTIWDSVNELSVDKLKKFAQYLVNELPKEYLPIAQRLLDQLKCPESEINLSHGAPDPTDGGHELYLPIAQRLLDQLKCPESEINLSHGAPDPTDGGHELTAIWALDVDGLHTSIRRLLIKYCVPAPTMLMASIPASADCLSSTAYQLRQFIGKLNLFPNNTCSLFFL